MKVKDIAQFRTYYRNMIPSREEAKSIDEHFIGSYNETNPLPEELAVYIVDHKNRIIQQLIDIDGNKNYPLKPYSIRVP